MLNHKKKDRETKDMSTFPQVADSPITASIHVHRRARSIGYGERSSDYYRIGRKMIKRGLQYEMGRGQSRGLNPYWSLGSCAVITWGSTGAGARGRHRARGDEPLTPLVGRSVVRRVRPRPQTHGPPISLSIFGCYAPPSPPLGV